MRANGYGADLELDAGVVTIYPGKAMARMAGTDRIAIPVADVESVDYRPANMLVNGELRIKVRDPDPDRLQRYGGRDALVIDEETRSRDVVDYAKKGLVTTESLVVHWRKKDQRDFEALHQALIDAVATA